MNKSRFSALAAAAALSLAALTACGGDPTQRIEAGMIPYLSTQMPLTAVDIRSRAAYDKAHIANSVFMENGVVPAELDDTPKETPLVVCGEGADGEEEERAAAALVKAGFKKVSILKGGMDAYLARNLHTQSSEDEQSARDIIEEFRKPKPTFNDALKDIKIEKPKL